ncbi:hypothetical protein GCM10027040_05100 [Halomonas shantousis]
MAYLAGYEAVRRLNDQLQQREHIAMRLELVASFIRGGVRHEDAAVMLADTSLDFRELVEAGGRATAGVHFPSSRGAVLPTTTGTQYCDALATSRLMLITGNRPSIHSSTEARDTVYQWLSRRKDATLRQVQYNLNGTKPFRVGSVHNRTAIQEAVQDLAHIGAIRRTGSRYYVVG